MSLPLIGLMFAVMPMSLSMLWISSPWLCMFWIPGPGIAIVNENPFG